MVRSVRRYDYEQVQKEVDAGDRRGVPVLLKEVGEKRVLLERRRGGATLPMPEQEVEEDENGDFRISFRPLLAAEDWNAQISLLTGMGAADLMLKGEVGILRTMPPPDPRDLARFRRQAAAAGVDVARGTGLRRVPPDAGPHRPRHLALIHEATSLFRGAGYTPFDGTVPEQPLHAAVANPYAHVTAPLRRLVDRFGLVVCEALSAGRQVPDLGARGAADAARDHVDVRPPHQRRRARVHRRRRGGRAASAPRRRRSRRWSSTRTRRASSSSSSSWPSWRRRPARPGRARRSPCASTRPRCRRARSR